MRAIEPGFLILRELITVTLSYKHDEVEELEEVIPLLKLSLIRKVVIAICRNESVAGERP